MNEAILYQIWKGKKILKHSFQTSEGHCIQIIHPGHKNLYSGPDFIQATIRINEVEWHGSVEIHVNASDWHLHKHSLDPAYRNVILHVVWNNDEPILDEHLRAIPCLCLKNYIKNPAAYIAKNVTDFFCKSFVGEVPAPIKEDMKVSCLKERLAIKASQVYSMWESSEKDWEETIYRLFAQAMGFQQNGEAMLRLASSIPLKLLWKYRHTPLRIEALLYGQAGLLQEFPHKKWVEKLKNEYELLKHKHQLESTYLQKSNWKFYKLRPQNYPTIRLLELGNLLRNNLSLLTFLLEIQELKNLRMFFEGYVENRKKSFGEQAFKSLVINAIVPILLVYAKVKAEIKYRKKAEQWLFELSPEGHHVEKAFLAIGIEALHAGDSQAFIHWFKQYCQKERCSSCAIGKYKMKMPEASIELCNSSTTHNVK